MHEITRDMIFWAPKNLVNGNECFSSFLQNGVTLCYTNTFISSVEIDGNSIENLFNIPIGDYSGDSLGYRITQEAINFILKKINEKK